MFPEVDGNDAVWQQKAAGGRTLGQHRRAIYEQFRPSFAFFELAFAEDVAPPGGIISLKATIGRRRFRDVNDTLAGPAQQPTRDPARMGGDYVDLASQNVSHFATDNFATWAAEHIKACEEHRAGKRGAALARDALGLHYLTDRFSAGHVVNKEELMTFATNLMVTVAESHGHNKGSRHDKIKGLMKDALKACFEAPALKVQWDLGCRGRVHAGAHQPWRLRAVDHARPTHAPGPDPGGRDGHAVAQRAWSDDPRRHLAELRAAVGADRQG